MKWFKVDAGFHLDGKVLMLNDKEFRIWMCILSEISEKYNGDPEQIFTIDFNRMVLHTKSKQNKFILGLKSVCSRFKISLNLKQNENEIIISYPKFLKKQESYFRGVTRNKQSIKIKIKDKDRERKEKKKEKGLDFRKISEMLIQHINCEAKRHFKPTKNTCSNIIARLKDGHSYDDLKRVINYKNRVDPFFKENPHLLNPTTLFRAKKFDDYMEEVRTHISKNEGEHGKA